MQHETHWRLYPNEHQRFRLCHNAVSQHNINSSKTNPPSPHNLFLYKQQSSNSREAGVFLLRTGLHHSICRCVLFGTVRRFRVASLSFLYNERGRCRALRTSCSPTTSTRKPCIWCDMVSCCVRSGSAHGHLLPGVGISTRPPPSPLELST